MKSRGLILICLLSINSCKITQYELSKNDKNEIYHLTFQRDTEEDVFKYDITLVDTLVPYKYRLFPNRFYDYFTKECYEENIYLTLEKKGKLPNGLSDFVKEHSFPKSQFRLKVMFSNIFYCEATKTAIVVIVRETEDKNGKISGGMARTLYVYRRDGNKWKFLDANYLSKS